MSFFAKLATSVAHLFTGIFDKALGTDDGKSLEGAVVAFVRTDVGALAVDAVNYASTLGPLGNDALRAAAVTKLKADLTAASKDATTLATSSLNLFVELAFTYVAGTLPALIVAAK